MNILQIPFVGAYELRKNLPALLVNLQKQNEAIVVTQKGKPEAVMISVKKYLEMQMLNEELEDSFRELTNKKDLLELIKAKEEIIQGKGKTAKKVFQELGI